MLNPKTTVDRIELLEDELRQAQAQNKERAELLEQIHAQLEDFILPLLRQDYEEEAEELEQTISIIHSALANGE